ncbi:unnamed protein product [Arctia plantaginis]|uniref:Uncharacterized protein n=1 Tax=Arctia plantaginis TaxID=874455 RepID=A0A8S1BT11_ARCPL|nr:unnamed protein product [Arctia plantaginis]
MNAQNIGYDCVSDQSNYTTISLVDIGDCHFDEDDSLENDTHIQLLQSKESMYISTFSCLINLHYTVMNCGAYGHNSLVKGGVVVETYRVGQEECNAMHKLRRARVCGQEFQINDFNVTNTRWINLAGGIDHDGTCTGGSFNNRFGNYANVVAYGQVSMLFSTGTALRLMQKDNIRLASGITCSLDSIR